MLLYPALALGINFVLFLMVPLLLRLFNVKRHSKEANTLKLLLPSLAPGLSCFPFILEFLGQGELAYAALADVGNKIFVLIFLYLIAMNLALRNDRSNDSLNQNSKLKSLFISLIKEPINLVILTAIILLTLGFNLESLPVFISEGISRFGAMMAPLILLFIGLAVKVKKDKLGLIFGLLLSRAGLTLLISAGLILIFNITSSSMILLTVVFPLSSCSFWPFAHMSTFNAITGDKKPFDLEFALLVLALSLPFSTLLILGILSEGQGFASVSIVTYGGLSLLAMGTVPALIRKVKWRINMQIDRPLGEKVVKPAE